MAAGSLNNVRMRCKQVCEDRFIAANEQWINPEGMLDACWARADERSHSFIGLWESGEKLVAARPQLIDHLNCLRDVLDELSPELGVNGPVSGPVITHEP